MEQPIANPEAAAFLEKRGSSLAGRPEGFRFEQPDFLFESEWPLLNHPCSAPFPENVIFRINVNHDQTIDEMLREGCYAAPTPKICFEDPKVAQDAEMDVLLVGFFEVVASTREVLARLGDLGLRPATIQETLMLSATYCNCDLPRHVPIVCLDELVRDEENRRSILCFECGEYQVRRLALLTGREHEWSISTRFAAVRRSH